MQLTPELRQELNYYRSIAEDEAEGDQGWTLTLIGYDAILKGQRLPSDTHEVMREELLHNEDKYTGALRLDYQDLLAHLGFRKRRAARPRVVEVIRDLDNPAYTIPHGKNHYCGPAALAYLLRTDPDAAAYLLREVTGKRAIYGCHASHILTVLGRYGLLSETRTHSRQYLTRRTFRTLRQWLEVEAGPKDAEYLVAITGHFIVIHGTRFFDNKAHLGKPLALCPYLRTRVRGAWRITKKVPGC